jgi:hypothetical protein
MSILVLAVEPDWLEFTVFRLMIELIHFLQNVL